MGGCESKATTANEFQVDAARHPNLQRLALTTTEKMGWIPDLPDHRDHYMSFKSIDTPKESREGTPTTPPQEGETKENRNRLFTGSTGTSRAGDHNVESHADLKDFTPSRLFIYYNERYVEGSVDQDAGAMLRDGVKVMAKKLGFLC
eukprot:g6800.t1